MTTLQLIALIFFVFSVLKVFALFKVLDLFKPKGDSPGQEVKEDDEAIVEEDDWEDESLF